MNGAGVLLDHRAVAGYRARPLLPVADDRERPRPVEARAAPAEGDGARPQEEEHRAGLLSQHERGRARAAGEDRRAAQPDQVPLGRRRRKRRDRAQGVRDHARPRAPRRGAAQASQGHLRPGQQADDQARNLQHDRHGLPPLRAEGDRDLLRPGHGARFPSRFPRRHLVRQGRHGGAGVEAENRRGHPRAGQGLRAAIQRRPDHPGREIQQGRRCLVEVHGEDRRSDDAGNLRHQAGGREGRRRRRSTRST